MTLCEEDCELKGYEADTKNAMCECPITIDIFKISQIKFNENQLYDQFTNITNIMNLNLMKCYKILFTKNGIINNIGSYIVIFVIMIYFISIIIFYKKDLKIIIALIDQMIISKNNLNKIQNINNIRKKNKKKVRKI